MLHPIVINPKLLIKAKDDEEILNNLSSFIKHYKEYWKDIFILVDDEKNTLTKKYVDIKNKYGHESYIFNSILDFIISSTPTLLCQDSFNTSFACFIDIFSSFT